MQQQIEEGIIGPHLTVVKAMLLSMLPLFISFWYYKKIILDLARQSTEVVTCILKLVEQGETSLLVEDVLQLEE